jgi:protein involved in polysaccharide export with SLBB domain
VGKHSERHGEPAKPVRTTRLGGARGALLAGFSISAAAFAVPQTAPVPADAAAAVATPVAYTARAEYRINPGDELSVVMPFNAELNHDGPVGIDGRFSMPLGGSLDLSGRTIPEAEAIINESLRRAGIVANARPSITVKRYGSTVYVGGEVRSPGAISLNGSTNPLQAIIMAGGLLDTARSKRVVIIRETDGKSAAYAVDVRSYAHRAIGSGAMTLQPRDIVFVPKSSIAEADLWVEQYLNKLLPFQRYITYNIGGGAFR